MEKDKIQVEVTWDYDERGGHEIYTTEMTREEWFSLPESARLQYAQDIARQVAGLTCKVIVPAEGDVHTAHCCKRHGCKYGARDCTVVHVGKPQEYMCEVCDDELRDGGITMAYALNDMYNIGFAAASDIMQKWIEEHYDDSTNLHVGWGGK